MSRLAPLSYTCRLRGSPLLEGFWEEKGTEEHEIRSSGRKDLDGPQGNVLPSAACIRIAQ